MVQYLVLLSCAMDDFPVALRATRRAALNVATKLSPVLDVGIVDLFGIDPSDPVCTKLITFKDGKPSKVEIVRDFSADSTESADIRKQIRKCSRPLEIVANMDSAEIADMERQIEKFSPPSGIGDWRPSAPRKRGSTAAANKEKKKRERAQRTAAHARHSP